MLKALSSFLDRQSVANTGALLSLVVSVLALVVAHRGERIARQSLRASQETEARRFLDVAVQELGPNPAAETYSPRSAEGLEKARQAVERAVRISPEDPDVLAYAALVAAMRGDTATAESLRMNAVARAPTQSFIAIRSADILWRTNRRDDALREYVRATRLPDAGSDATHSLAVALERSGRREEAVQQYWRALAMNMYSVPSYASLAGLLLELGRYQDGLEVCNRATSNASSDDWRVKTNCSQLQLRAGDAESALDLATRALELRPDMSYAWVARAEALERLGMPDKAVEAFSRASSFDPMNQELARLASEAQVRLGKKLLWGTRRQR